MDELQWTVVQFKNHPNKDTLEKVEISVIPVKWLSEIDGRLHCVWPSTKERKHIKNASVPKDSWAKYAVENLLDSPVAYRDAIAEERRIVESASEDDAHEVRKKKPTAHPDFIEMDTDSDDTRSFTSTDLMPPPPPPQFSLEPPNVNAVEDQQLDFENSEIIFGDDFQFDEKNQINVKMDAILKQTIENRILLERIINNMHNFNNNNYNDNLPSTGCEILTKPFTKYSGLTKFDKKIAECEDSKKQLESIFVRCGGVSEKDNIVRGLRKIFSDKLAKKCSWLGRKKNYPISELFVIKILKVAVTRNFPSLKDKTYEKLVANWLRQAMLRYTRSQR